MVGAGRWCFQDKKKSILCGSLSSTEDQTRILGFQVASIEEDYATGNDLNLVNFDSF